MKKLFTILTLLLVLAISASAALQPLRISVATTPQTGKQLTVHILNPAGTTVLATIDKGSSVATDDGGVLSFLLTSTDLGVLTYDANNLIRVTYGGVVLSIERMEVVYAKQGLFGALVEPNEIAAGPVGYVLTSDGTTNNWETTSSISEVGTISEGTWEGDPVAITYGGTGAITKSGAFDALSPMTTLGDMIYGAALGTATRLGIGTAGQIFQVNATPIPSWVSMSGDVTIATGGATTIGASKVISSMINDLTIVNGDIATAAGIVVTKLSTGGANQVILGNGTANAWGALTDAYIPNTITIDLSTRATNIVGGLAGSIPYQNAVNATSLLGIGTAGQILRVTAGAPAWSDVSTAMADLTAANTTLTFSAAYDGSAARTVGLNLANANNWTGAQTFTGTAGPLVLEGTAGGSKTTINVTDPTTDQTITIPNASGIVALQSGAFTAGSVIFSDGTNLLQDNSNFYYNSTTKQLGIGVIPTTALDVNGTITLRGATTGYVGLLAHPSGDDYNLRFPVDSPPVAQSVLVSATDGVMSWATLTSGTITGLNTSAPITGGPITVSGTIGITKSGSAQDGYLSSTDWTTFNAKQNWDNDLDEIAALDHLTGYFMVGNGTQWIALSPAASLVSIGAEPLIAGGTPAQYWRGDKTWQTLNKTTIGLGNVDNTTDLLKPISTAAQNALDLKMNITGGTFTGNIYASNLQGNNTGDQLDIGGNAATATALETGREINGVLFDGTANITVYDATKEPAITAGTASDYWRGDKTWQTLNKAAVGLSDVENTALSTWAGTGNITTLGTITSGVWNGTVVAVADGGTGASTAAQARTNLDVQRLNANLTAISGGTWTGAGSITTVGTITSGEWTGTIIADAYVVNTLTITGGTVNNSPIGASTPSTGVFTSLFVKPIGTAAGETGGIALQELLANAEHAVTLKAPDAVTENYDIILPSNKPATNQFLITDGATGQLVWETFDLSAINLDNVDNVKQIPYDQLGAVNGVATLGADGKVLPSQLPTTPAIVQVLSTLDLTTNYSGANNTIYVTKDLGKLYVWTGTPNIFAEVAAGLTLGVGATQAYYGDLGKIAYDHSQRHGTGTETDANPHRMEKADIGLGNVENTQLSSWPGSANLVNLGSPVATGEWRATPIANAYVADNLTIDDGNIINTPIGSGAGNASTGRFSSVTLAGSTSGDITWQAPATTATYTLTMPSTGPAVNQFLINNGTTPGVFVWANILPAMVSLGNVQNINILTWAGTANLTTLGTITSGTWNGSTLAIAYGGTGATDAATARTNLGLAIGSNVEAWDADLDAIAALTTTAYGRGLLELADAAALNTSLGLGTMSTQNANAVAITGGTIAGATVTGGTINGTPIGATTAATGRFNGVTIKDAGFTGTVGLLAAASNFTPYTVTLPILPPSTGQMLTQSSSPGQLVWQTPTTGTITSIVVTAPLTGGTITSTGTIGIAKADGANDGYLDNVDWNTFNAKQNADQQLIDIAAIDPADGTLLVGNGTTFVPKSGIQVRTIIDAQQANINLSAISAGTWVGAGSITTLGTITTGIWNGTAIADANVVDALTISGGTVNNTIIGGSFPAAATFTDVTTTNLTCIPTGTAAGQTGAITLKELTASGGKTVKVRAPDALDASYVFTLPVNGGTAIGQVLSTNTSGITSWIVPVSTVSVVTANGISGVVATPTSTPAITLTLGAITPTTVNGLTLTSQATGFTIAGGTSSKTLTVTGDVTLAGASSGTNTGDVSIGAPANGLSIAAGQVLSLGLASSGVTGALSGTDWNTFNGKQNLLTNSAGLAGALTDENGTGTVVFSTNPTLTTPTLGVASATTINKVTITAPAAGSTLTIANGATLTASATATVSGTNTGDQTTIVGITGTIAQFNTALTDGDFATGGGTATGSNTGDNAVNSLYSGLATSKADLAGATFTGAISATNLSGTNTGDNAVNTLYSGLATSKADLSGATFTGAISATNLSGTNTGDNAVNTLYSGLATSKADLSGATFTGAISATNLTGTNTGDIQDVSYEFTATGGETSFILPYAPSANSIVKLYINGVRISNAAITFSSGTTYNYVSTANGNYVIVEDDRIQIDYFYIP